MHTSPQVRLRVHQAREKFRQQARQRWYERVACPPLETPRLWLCVPHRGDKCHLTEFTTTVEAESVQGGIVATVKVEKAPEDSGITWFIYHKSNPLEEIGSISLFQFTAPDARITSAMLGYTLCEYERGKGYMTEALHAIVNFTFDKLGLQRIEARVKTTNERSKAVVKRAGFKYTETARRGRWSFNDDSKGIQLLEQEVWLLNRAEWAAGAGDSYHANRL